LRPYSVTARNSAVLAENKMHDDAVAREFGFRGGLVPGVDVFAYLCHPSAEAWGEAWLSGGRIRARFVHPVYDGDEVRVEPVADGALVVRDPDGTVCAEGTVCAQGAVGSGDVADVPEAGVLPVDRPEPSIAGFVAAPLLGPIQAGFHADRAGEYLDQIGEDLPLFRDGGVAHPGWLLRQANFVLTANVRLGPWIHTSSDCVLLAPVRDGAVVETRARVVRAWEAKGHQLVQLDVAVLADGEPAMRVDHAAIFQPRRDR
jgi:acyl dehydratase